MAGQMNTWRTGVNGSLGGSEATTYHLGRARNDSETKLLHHLPCSSYFREQLWLRQDLHAGWWLDWQHRPY